MDKKEAKKLMSEIRKIFNEWDFLSAAALGVEDEYDCLIGPVAILVGKGEGRDKIRLIEEELKNHFGLEGAYSKEHLEEALDKLIALE